MVSAYNKFIVALVGLVAAYANSKGVDGIDELSNSVIAFLTAVGVFFVPNR